MFALDHHSGFASGRARFRSTPAAATRFARLVRAMPIIWRIDSSAVIRQGAFDPFFTTPRDPGGTELGLHVIFNIVTRSLGGRRAMDSAPGRGTTFRITIPRHATAAAAATE